jgi:hypothetical protein
MMYKRNSLPLCLLQENVVFGEVGKNTSVSVLWNALEVLCSGHLCLFCYLLCSSLTNSMSFSLGNYHFSMDKVLGG